MAGRVPPASAAIVGDLGVNPTSLQGDFSNAPGGDASRTVDVPSGRRPAVPDRRLGAQRRSGHCGPLVGRSASSRRGLAFSTPVASTSNLPASVVAPSGYAVTCRRRTSVRSGARDVDDDAARPRRRRLHGLSPA